MVVFTYSEFRKNLKQNLDSACDDKEVVVVSRAHDKNVVLISLKEYHSWLETNSLSSTANNHHPLEEAIKRAGQRIFEQRTC